MINYRKQTVSPLYVYNIFNNVYFQYFENHNVRHARKIDPNVETYIASFISNNFYKFHSSISIFEDYLRWVFQQHGRVSIRMIHSFVDEWEKSNTNEVIPFSAEVVKYLRDNYISFEEYIAVQKSYFPTILQHYIADKSIPFELILYLGILDKVEKKNRATLKMLLSKEYYDMKKHEEKLNANKLFIEHELKNVKSSF